MRLLYLYFSRFVLKHTIFTRFMENFLLRTTDYTEQIHENKDKTHKKVMVARTEKAKKSGRAESRTQQVRTKKPRSIFWTLVF